MNKICIIYNFAQKYREAIYKLIDKEWECDWYFGQNNTDIAGFETEILKNAKIVSTKIIKDPFYYKKGVFKLLWNKKYNTFLMLGDFNCLTTWSILLFKPLIAPHKKIYLWTHGWYGRESKTKKFLKKIFFHNADAILLYGNYARNLMIKEGYNPDKLFVIHNSLDFENQSNLRLSVPNDSPFVNHFKNNLPNLIFIGRLTKVKRLDMIIEAMKILAERNVKVNLTLIGNGSEIESLKYLTQKNNLTDRVWFYGACYDDNLNASLIYHSDLCVAPGNVGLTAMHSMAYGTPVLTHDNFTMQMPEFEAIKEGLTGSFFKYESVSSLADTIESWIRDNKDRDMIRQNCIAEIASSWTPEFQLSVLKRVMS